LDSEPLREVIVAFGHENILATHPTTLMITKDSHVSKTGDCIIAVSADKASADLNSAFKEKLKKENTKLTIVIEIDEIKETVCAFGNSKLILTHPNDIVIRKSDYISDRTIAIRADKSSSNLSKELVKRLKNPKQKIKITLTLD
jgi:uncharacterized protein